MITATGSDSWKLILWTGTKKALKKVKIMTSEKWREMINRGVATSIEC